MLASFHSFGMVPELSDRLNNKQSEGAITSAVSLSSFAGIPSGPVAFDPRNVEYL